MWRGPVTRSRARWAWAWALCIGPRTNTQSQTPRFGRCRPLHTPRKTGAQRRCGSGLARKWFPAAPLKRWAKLCRPARRDWISSVQAQLMSPVCVAHPFDFTQDRLCRYAARVGQPTDSSPVGMPPREFPWLCPPRPPPNTLQISMRLILVKRRRRHRLPPELDIEIIVLLLWRRTAVIGYRVPESAEESSIGLRQPHVHIVSEASWG